MLGTWTRDPNERTHWWADEVQVELTGVSHPQAGLCCNRVDYCQSGFSTVNWFLLQSRFVGWVVRSFPAPGCWQRFGVWNGSSITASLSTAALAPSIPFCSILFLCCHKIWKHRDTKDFNREREEREVLFRWDEWEREKVHLRKSVCVINLF